MKTRGHPLTPYAWIVLIAAASCIGAIAYVFVSAWLS